MASASPILTVSQVTQHIKTVFDADPLLVDVGVRGEISNYKHHASGHIYFSLKDSGSQIPCVMFRREAGTLDFRPSDGLEVTCYGRIGVYEPHGRYQLYVRSMEAAGRGALYEAFERLKAQLEAEGLFDQAHKKPLPRFPERIGIISSATGAGLRDMLTIMARRYPPARLCVVPSLVQGSEAPPQLIRAVELADRAGGFDVIIIGRGGGSMEDLWCFNDEGLARAVYACRTPTVSAVGHEIDFTICDFVADARAATPSAAAEMVTPDGEELRAALHRVGARLRNGLRRSADLASARLTVLARHRLWLSPSELTGDRRILLDDLQDAATSALTTRLERLSGRLDRAGARMQTLGPAQVMARGYSIARRADGRIIRSIGDVRPGDDAEILVRDGAVDAAVTGVREAALGQD